MLMSIFIPLIYYFSGRGKNRKRSSEEEKKPKSPGANKKTYLPINDLFQRDIYGKITTEVHNYPYGPDDICHINRLPRTLDEYYAYKPTFLRSKEWSNPNVSTYKPKFIDEGSREKIKFDEPYVGRPETDEDRRRRAAWDEYRMDYMGMDSSENIIARLTDTLHEPQFHPHTYLPNNDEIPLIPGHHPFHYPPEG